MLSASQIDAVAKMMQEVAAEYILPRFQTLTADEIDTKSGPHDLVTIADREAEWALALRLRDLLPGSVVVGEEGVAADPSVLDLLLTDDYIWLVDPVDGTANFVKGCDKFAVMVALVHRGETLAGWIYPPIENVMAITERGSGATLDDAKLEGRKDVPFQAAAGDYSTRYVPEPYRASLSSAFAKAAATREGHCSAYAYLDTARGDIDFVMQYLMSPWDHAPGALMVEEAGGTVQFLDNKEPYTVKQRTPRAMLAVGDREEWDVYSRVLTSTA